MKTNIIPIETYLAEHSRSLRLDFLKQMRTSSQTVPVTLTEDLLNLNLGVEELQAVIQVSDSRDELALELFLADLIMSADQDLATTALAEWGLRTSGMLWFLLAEAAAANSFPQRVLYALLNDHLRVGGAHILNAVAASDAYKDFSEAFHALLFQRAIDWNQPDRKWQKLAESYLPLVDNHETSTDRVVIKAILYLARFAPERLLPLLGRAQLSEFSRQLIHGLILSSQHTKLEPGEGIEVEDLIKNWPSQVYRHQLSFDQLSKSVLLFSKRSIDFSQFLTAVHRPTLLKAILRITDSEAFLSSLSVLNPFPETLFASELIDHLAELFAKSNNPAELMRRLPLSTRIAINKRTKKATMEASPEEFVMQLSMRAIEALSKKAPFGQNRDQVANALRRSKGKRLSEDLHDAAARKRFFDMAYRSQVQVIESAINDDDQSYWGLLAKAWRQPSIDQLDPLSTIARQQPAVFRIPYIHTLGRFAGEDKAALKLLDFVRTEEDDELLAVIHALSGIGSPRALQELVSSITRPNITTNLQFEICNLLQGKDLTHVQEELRSAIADLQIKEKKRDDQRELQEALRALLVTHEEGSAHLDARPISQDVSTGELDKALRAKIPDYDETSSEVRRALRTAEFFHQHVSGSADQSHIDLSPVIDMQYKALELLFRENFESFSNRLIHAGILQRKLDVIGYARPIPAKMDKFEDFISSLPIIDSIPYFSKFKLRKMLRALCQFRPGKRFTLDGLKAFGLFFLCFSRHHCRYGLENIFPLPFTSDLELAKFVKELHVFQDFRNRAAHEGFQPQARQDIEGIWTATSEIIAHAYRMRTFLQEKKGDTVKVA